MDKITEDALFALSKQHPSAAITFSHQFLDGSDKHECGFVPNDYDGTGLYFEIEKD